MIFRLSILKIFFIRNLRQLFINSDIKSSFVIKFIRIFIILYMSDDSVYYQDKDVIIKGDRVIIKCYFFPFGNSKTIKFSEI